MTYPVHVIKMITYTLDQIFRKNLLFLIPFYIFTHENHFIEYNENTDKLQKLLAEYKEIKDRLETLNEQGLISEFTKCTIIDMSNKVLEHIARNYKQITKGVKAVMGGKILEYEAKTILNKGRTEGKIVAYAEMIRDGYISVSEAAARLNIPVEKLEEFLKE